MVVYQTVFSEPPHCGESTIDDLIPELEHRESFEEFFGEAKSDSSLA